MSTGLDTDITIYVAMSENIIRYDDWLEAENVLIWRDAIHDELEVGAKLSGEQEKLLAEADDRLLAARETIVARFPQAFWGEAATKDRWWWHLPDGPDVREKAREAV